MCDAPLEAASLRSGATQCPACKRPFEATPFQPRELRHEAVQSVTETPEGVATACANHAGNAAVTSCQRCGLFICSLCDLDTGEGSYCPSCFERIRTGGAQTGVRYRDYASMAASGAVFGLLCSLLPLGPFVVYWAWKGIRQRRQESSGIAGVVVAMTFGILETVAFFGGVVLLVIGMVSG